MIYILVESFICVLQYIYIYVCNCGINSVFNTLQLTFNDYQFPLRSHM